MLSQLILSIQGSQQVCVLAPISTLVVQSDAMSVANSVSFSLVSLNISIANTLIEQSVALIQQSVCKIISDSVKRLLNQKWQSQNGCALAL